MTDNDEKIAIAVEVLDETSEVTLVELCQTCSVQADLIEELVAHGVLEPSGKRGHHWYFGASSIRRTRVAMRLQKDLGVNMAGVGLALELLDRIDKLSARLQSASRR